MFRARPSSLVGKTTSVWVTQATIMCAQIVYAGVSSRNLSAPGFGAYAVALTLTSFTGIIAGLGLATAAARRGSTTDSEQRALAGVALLSGLMVALVMIVIAGPWSALWQNPAAAPLTRLLAAGTLAAPYAGVIMGTLRRQGRILALNVVTVSTSLVGMLIGAWAITATQEPWALTVMPILTSTLLAVSGAVVVGRTAVPSLHLNEVKAHISFGGRSMATAFITITAYAISQVGMSRSLGAGVLGSWNRGTVVGQLPAESAVRAVLTVTFPHFPMQRLTEAERRRTRTDLTVSFALVFWPICALFVALIPGITVLWLGSSWAVAGQMAMWLWITAAVQAPRTVLASLLEASAEFRVLVSGEVILAIGLVLATAVMIRQGDWLPLACGGLLASIASHGVQVLLADRRGLIDGRKILHNYVPLVVAGALWGLVSSVVVASQSPTITLVITAIEAALLAVVLFWMTRRPGPLRRVTRRGLRPGNRLPTNQAETDTDA